MTISNRQFHTLRCGHRSLPLGPHALIMGVLNVTPDSFSDGGQYVDPGRAVERVHRMIAEGADIVDIGGESTRPGASYVSEEEEIRRIGPVLKLLGKATTVPLSIDTRKSAVARIALDFGAVIVNDVSALQDDPDMADVIRDYQAGLVLMHRQGHSSTMQESPSYGDIVDDIKVFLRERIEVAQEFGIHRDQIMLDPGIGFGKTTQHNLRILGNIEAFLELDFPLLIGLSRKAFLGKLTGRPVDQREFGHAAALSIATWQGAHIFRVHDVGAMKEVLQVAQAVKNSCDK